MARKQKQSTAPEAADGGLLALGGGTQTRPAAEPLIEGGRKGTDLFTFIDALWTKARPEGTPPIFIMHRFLASERSLAAAAAILGREVHEAQLVFRTWQGLLPTESRAPRLYYAAPKKPPAEEELVRRIMEIEKERRATAELMVTLVRAAGREAELYAEYGVERKDD